MQQVYLSSHNAQQRGFTLIELIMVIVMLGILAVFAAPRMFNSGDFYARGFHDETLALLRYAQKTAVAQRRTVCVVFPDTRSVTLTIAETEANSNCTKLLVGPKGEAQAKIQAAGEVAYSDTLTNPQPTNFNFNGLGQPSVAQNLTVTNNGAAISLSVTVEAETGYVHD